MKFQALQSAAARVATAIEEALDASPSGALPTAQVAEKAGLDPALVEAICLLSTDPEVQASGEGFCQVRKVGVRSFRADSASRSAKAEKQANTRKRGVPGVPASYFLEVSQRIGAETSKILEVAMKLPATLDAGSFILAMREVGAGEEVVLHETQAMLARIAGRAPAPEAQASDDEGF